MLGHRTGPLAGGAPFGGDSNVDGRAPPPIGFRVQVDNNQQANATESTAGQLTGTETRDRNNEQQQQQQVGPSRAESSESLYQGDAWMRLWFQRVMILSFIRMVIFIRKVYEDYHATKTYSVAGSAGKFLIASATLFLPTIVFTIYRVCRYLQVTLPTLRDVAEQETCHSQQQQTTTTTTTTGVSVPERPPRKRSSGFDDDAHLRRALMSSPSATSADEDQQTTAAAAAAASIELRQKPQPSHLEAPSSGDEVNQKEAQNEPPAANQQIENTNNWSLAEHATLIAQILGLFAIPSLFYWPIMFNLKLHFRPFKYLVLILTQNFILIPTIYYSISQSPTPGQLYLLGCVGVLSIVGFIFVSLYVACKPSLTEYFARADELFNEAEQAGVYFEFCSRVFKMPDLSQHAFKRLMNQTEFIVEEQYLEEQE